MENEAGTTPRRSGPPRRDRTGGSTPAGGEPEITETPAGNGEPGATPRRDADNVPTNDDPAQRDQAGTTQAETNQAGTNQATTNQAGTNQAPPGGRRWRAHENRRRRDQRRNEHYRGGPERWRGGPPWGRGSDRRPHVSLILALVVFIVEVAGAHWAGPHQPGAHSLDHLGYALLAASCVALALRPLARVPAFVVTLSATVIYVVLDFPYGPVFLALLISIFGAVRTGHRIGVWISLAIGYGTFIAAGRIVPTLGPYTLRQPSVGLAIQVGVWFALALAVAEAIRVRSAHFAEARRAAVEKARAHDEQERRQASEERLRIAQELHDVLGHHLSLINVQAGVGLHLMGDQPDQARVALEAIKQASAEALSEVRAVLGALRPKDERAPRAPEPTLGDLATLVDPAHTIVRGRRRAVPPEVDRAAFRIVQESLTNVRRHAGPGATGTVTLVFEPERLVVRIADDGLGPRAGAGSTDEDHDGGTGIAGMRTRAEALGGVLVAGAGPITGFVVEAVLPIPAQAPAPVEEPI